MKRNAQMSADVLISGALGIAAIAVGLASLTATAKRMQEHDERHEALMADMDAEHQLRMKRIKLVSEQVNSAEKTSSETQAELSAEVQRMVDEAMRRSDKLRAEDAEIVE